MKRAMRLFAAVGILGMFSAACGDDRPSSEEFKAKVTEICQATGARHEEASSGFDFESFDPATSDLSEIVPLIEDNVAIGREAVAELNKVRGPKADEETLDAWIEVEKRVSDNAADMIEAANSGDSDQFLAFVAVEDELMAEHSSPEFAIFEGC